MKRTPTLGLIFCLLVCEVCHLGAMPKMFAVPQATQPVIQPAITDELIARKRQEVKLIMNRRYWIRAGVKIAMITGACYALYSWFSRTPVVPEVGNSVTSIDDLAKHVLERPDAQAHELIEPLKKILHTPAGIEPSNGIFLSLGKKIYKSAATCARVISHYTVGAMLVSGAIKMNKLYFQSPNLAWFMDEHTEWFSVRHALEGLCKQRIPALREQIFARLVELIAAQIAFMKYTVNHVPQDVPARAYMKNQVMLCCQQLRDCVHNIGAALHGGDMALGCAIKSFIDMHEQASLIFKPIEDAAGVSDGIGQDIMQIINLVPVLAHPFLF